MNTKLILSDRQASVSLKPLSDATLEDLLKINGLPPSLFQAYYRNQSGETTPIPLNKKCNETPDGSCLEIQAIRHIEFSKVIPRAENTVRSNGAVTTIDSLEFSRGHCTKTSHEISQSDAQQIVSDCVADFLDKYAKKSKLLVGLSGGADSNALITALSAASARTKKKYSITAFTLVMDPVWSSESVGRAKALAESAGAKHLFIGDNEIQELLGLNCSIYKVRDAFAKEYSPDIHIFATFLISAVARKLGEKLRITDYCLGFNREDVFAEMMFSLVNGLKPLSFPVRRFGDFNLLMPVYEVPKRILDACHAVHSQAVYAERPDTEASPNTTFQRSLAYLLAYSIDGAHPALTASLMAGVQKLFGADASPMNPADKRGLIYPTPYASAAEVKSFNAFMKKFLA